MDSASPTTDAGTSVQMRVEDTCMNTFWKSVENNRHNSASWAEFAHVFRARPRYRRRVRESPQATGDGLVA